MRGERGEVRAGGERRGKGERGKELSGLPRGSPEAHIQDGPLQGCRVVIDIVGPKAEHTHEEQEEEAVHPPPRVAGQERLTAEPAVREEGTVSVLQLLHVAAVPKVADNTHAPLTPYAAPP